MKYTKILILRVYGIFAGSVLASAGWPVYQKFYIVLYLLFRKGKNSYGTPALILTIVLIRFGVWSYY